MLVLEPVNTKGENSRIKIGKMIESGYGNNKRDVRKNRVFVSETKKSAKNKQFGGVKCNLTCIGKW